MQCRHILLTLLTLLIFYSVTHAQDIKFQKLYGAADNSSNASGTCVQVATDGGYIISGATSNFGAGANDVWLLKTDTGGNLTWNSSFGGDSDDVANYVIQTIDGGYAVTGATHSFGGVNMFLIKTDANGNAIWSTIYGTGDNTSNSSGACVQQTHADSGYIIAGYTSNYGAGGHDFYLVKTDASGNKQWAKTYGGFNADDANYVIQPKSGGYVIVGTTSSFADTTACNIYLVRTDDGGNVIWSKEYGTEAAPPFNFDIAKSIWQTTDNGYVIFGTTRTDTSGKFGTILKTDSSGDVLWWNVFETAADSTSNASLSNGLQTTDGGFLCTGYTGNYGAGSADFLILKLNIDGDTLWTRAYGSAAADSAAFIRPTPDGEIMAGVTYGYTGGKHLLLVKADVFGNSECNTYATHTAVNPNYQLKIRSFPSTEVTSGGVSKTVVFSQSSGGTILDACNISTGADELLSAQQDITVFPIPFDETATLQLSTALSNSGKSQLIIFDVLGNIISRTVIQQGQQVVTITRGSLPAGMYFYHLTSDRGVVNNGKLIIE